jgi:hypothetical protein
MLENIGFGSKILTEFEKLKKFWKFEEIFILNIFLIFKL